MHQIKEGAAQSQAPVQPFQVLQPSATASALSILQPAAANRAAQTTLSDRATKTSFLHHLHLSQPHKTPICRAFSWYCSTFCAHSSGGTELLQCLPSSAVPLPTNVLGVLLAARWNFTFLTFRGPDEHKRLHRPGIVLPILVDSLSRRKWPGMGSPICH